MLGREFDGLFAAAKATEPARSETTKAALSGRLYLSFVEIYYRDFFPAALTFAHRRFAAAANAARPAALMRRLLLPRAFGDATTRAVLLAVVSRPLARPLNSAIAESILVLSASNALIASAIVF